MPVPSIEQRLAALERNSSPRGPLSTTAFGGSAQPFQVGLVAETTAVFSSTRGYAWKQALIDQTTTPVTVAVPTVYRTGDLAFTPGNDTTLAIGTRGWLELDPQAKGYIFTPVPVATVSAWKEPVRVRTTGNVTISNPGTSTFDSVVLTSGDRVGVWSQSSGAENGIYLFNGSSSAMTRTTDCDAAAEFIGATAYVSEGTIYADTYWTCTTNATITVGTTSTTWAQTPSASRTIAGYVNTTTQSFLGTKTFTGTSSGTTGGVVVTPASGSASLSVQYNTAAPSYAQWTLTSGSLSVDPTITVNALDGVGGSITYGYIDIKADGFPFLNWQFNGTSGDGGIYCPHIWALAHYAHASYGYGVYNGAGGAVSYGATGTLSDGSTLKCGLITTIGGGGGAITSIGGSTPTSLTGILTGNGTDIDAGQLSGDVTTTGSSLAATIANDAVTYAKMQNVSATDKVLGRSTAGVGDVEEIACTSTGRSVIAAASGNAATVILIQSLTDAAAANSSLYFSTDSNKLSWKDAGGTANPLY